MWKHILPKFDIFISIITKIFHSSKRAWKNEKRKAQNFEKIFAALIDEGLVFITQKEFLWVDKNKIQKSRHKEGGQRHGNAYQLKNKTKLLQMKSYLILLIIRKTQIKLIHPFMLFGHKDIFDSDKVKH